VWVLGNQDGTPYVGPIDQRTGRFVDLFPKLPGQYGRTLAVADGYLFAAMETGDPTIDGTKLLQFDPAERSLLGGIDLPYAAVGSDGHSLWGMSSAVIQLSVNASGDVESAQQENIGATGDAMAVGESHVWFFGAANARAVGGYSPATGQVDVTAQVGGIAMAVSPGAVWVVDGQSLIQVEIPGAASRMTWADQPAVAPGQVASPAFEEAPGWSYLPSVVTPGDTNVAMTWVSTRPFAKEDLDGIRSGVLPVPYESLVRLGPDDVFIVASFVNPGMFEDPTVVLPAAQLPLSLAEADRRAQWEGQVADNVPEYVLWRTVDRMRLDVRVYFGTQTPSDEVMTRAQSMLSSMSLPEWDLGGKGAA
jgi:hypothetical protein